MDELGGIIVGRCKMFGHIVCILGLLCGSRNMVSCRFEWWYQSNFFVATAGTKIIMVGPFRQISDLCDSRR